MPVPYLGRALIGWTSRTKAYIITQTVTNHRVQESSVEIILAVNRQPMPMTKILKKPEEQRTWRWWTFLVQEGPMLKTDDIIQIGTIKYRIMNHSNWSESGFQEYEAIEDYS